MRGAVGCLVFVSLGSSCYNGRERGCAVGDMIELPRVKELKASIEKLRQSVVEAICTKEYLLHVKGRAIEMNYCLAFYDQEIAILEARCRTLVLARERERILSGKTTAGKIAEAQMDEILAQWEGELARKKALLAEARTWKAWPAAKEKELNGLMILIIKARHPDLNPEHGDEKFMEKAVEAFREGDEKALKELLNEAKREASQSPPERLLKEEKRLEYLLLGYIKKVTAIKQRPPFTAAFYLEGEGRKARWEELERERQRAEKAQEKEKAALENAPEEANLRGKRPREKKR